MTAQIFRATADEVWGLIYVEHLSILGTMERETLERSLHNSARLWIGLDGDKVLAFWGLIAPTLLSDIAYLWLYTTKDLGAHNFMLVRHSQRLVQQMLEEYPTIHGHGAVGATRSLRWLRWLGAEFGPAQGKFLPFTIKASQWPQDSVQSA